MSTNEQNSNPQTQVSVSLMPPAIAVLLCFLVITGFGLLVFTQIHSEESTAGAAPTAVVEEEIFVYLEPNDYVAVPDGYKVSYHAYNEWLAQPHELRDECQLFYDALRRYVDDTWIEEHRPDGFCPNDPGTLRQCIFYFDSRLSPSVYCGGRSAWRFRYAGSGMTIDEEISLELDLLFNQKYLRVP